jgi:predicted nucleotidyltransferase
MSDIEENQKQVLLDIKTVVDSLGLSILVVGAGARIIIFDNQYDITGRATTDLDFAVQVSDWQDFQAFITAMTDGNNPFFQETPVQHRLIHIVTKIEVDVVPFGAIGEPNQEIEWSDGNQMSILGFDEAFSTAESRTIEGIEFNFVNLPGFLVLKLIAWSDRKASKDIEDIYFILENYSDGDRVFEELIDELSEGIIEYEEAAAFILGRDIQNLFSQAVISKLQEILTQIIQNQASLFPELIFKLLEAEQWDAKFNTIVRLFAALKKGIGYTNQG